MAGVFPFREVKQGSKIVLYGAGALGKEFYMQLKDTNWCKILAWVDKRFEGYELSYPFDYVENISNYSDMDYCVIAVADYNIGISIRNKLKVMGIDSKKIIHHPGEYYKDYRLFPANRDLFLTRLDDYMEIINAYLDSESIYAGKRWGFFYESFSGIGLDGVRSSQERIERYGLRDILNKNQTVLDIGCNSGFLALQIAPYVKSIVGIELDSKQVEVGRMVSKLSGIDNVTFVADDFNNYCEDNTFDIVMCLAVHEYIVGSDGTCAKLASKVQSLIKEGGYLVFESQIAVDRQFYELCYQFENGMEIIKKGSYFETFHMSEREFRVYRKK